ncbi:unnamed protein product [Penicillium salamii]|nr:unnamed protein product [Penicillium salamii]
MSESPWKNQNSRQDISEELYLRMNFSGEDFGIEPTARAGSFSTKLTLNSTSGIFELPNYANGGTPGPLLPEDSSTKDVKGLRIRDLDDDTALNTLNATQRASSTRNKGPLENIALALFGEGSFADVNHTVLAAYANSNVTYDTCIGMPQQSFSRVQPMFNSPNGPTWWLQTLDSFAMLRIGASISEKVPLLATQHVDRIKVLDETPGWIGNSSEGKVGKLSLGGELSLRKTKRYISYDTKKEVVQQRKVRHRRRLDEKSALWVQG